MIETENSLKMLTDELIEVRRFCYLNGFYRCDLKEMVNNEEYKGIIDAYTMSAGSLRIILTIHYIDYKGGFYSYRIASVADYTKNASDGSLQTRNFQSIKDFYKSILEKRFRIINEKEI